VGQMLISSPQPVHAAASTDMVDGARQPQAASAQYDALVPDLIARFGRLDPTGSGTIAVDLFKELLRRIGFTESVLDVVMASSGIGDSKAIRYAEFVSWLFSDPTASLALSQATSGDLARQVSADEAAQPVFTSEAESIADSAVDSATASTPSVRQELSLPGPRRCVSFPDRDEVLAEAFSPKHHHLEAVGEESPRVAAELVKRASALSKKPRSRQGTDSNPLDDIEPGFRVQRTVTWQMEDSVSVEGGAAEAGNAEGADAAAAIVDPASLDEAALEMLMYDMIDPFTINDPVSFMSEDDDDEMRVLETSQSMRSVATGCSEFWQDVSASKCKSKSARIDLELSSKRRQLAKEDEEEELGLERSDSDSSGGTPKSGQTRVTRTTRRANANVLERPEFNNSQSGISGVSSARSLSVATVEDESTNQ